MHDIHESSFQCQFDSPSGRCVVHVRAWDAEEALQLFVTELRAEGVEEAGDVVVSPLHGRGGGPRARLRPQHTAALAGRTRCLWGA